MGQGERFTLHHGDVTEIAASIESNTFDAVLCDPRCSVCSHGESDCERCEGTALEACAECEVREMKERGRNA